MKAIHEKSKKFKRLEMEQEIIMTVIWNNKKKLTKEKIIQGSHIYKDGLKHKNLEKAFESLLENNYIEEIKGSYKALLDKELYTMRCRLSLFRHWMPTTSGIIDKIVTFVANKTLSTYCRTYHRRVEEIEEIKKIIDELF